VPLTQTYLMHDTTSPFFFLVQGFTMLHVGFQAAFFTTTNLPCWHAKPAGYAAGRPRLDL